MKQKLYFILRVIFGLGLFFVLGYKIGFQRILFLLRGVQIHLLFVAFLTFLLAIFSSSMRWKVILSIEKNISLLGLVRVYLASLFLANFLPSGGIDLLRAVYLSQFTRKRAFSFASVLVDRFLGLIAIIVFVILGISLGMEELRKFRKVTALISLSLVFLLFFLFSEKTNQFLDPILRKVPFGEKFLNLLTALQKYKKSPQLLLNGFLISLLIQFLFVVTAYFDALSLSLHPPFLKTIVYVSLINLIAMVPITVSGIGVREGGFVLLFSGIIAKESAFALSFLYYLTSVLVSLIGGILLLVGKEKISPSSEGVPRAQRSS